MMHCNTVRIVNGNKAYIKFCFHFCKQVFYFPIAKTKIGREVFFKLYLRRINI